MKIKVETIRSTITEMPSKPYDTRLIKAFTIKSPESFWKTTWRPGWSGATAFISPKTHKFGTGLLERILKWASDNDIPVELDDQRTMPVVYPSPIITENYLTGMTLRDYQVDGIKMALEKRLGLLGMATGSGKTATIAGIIKAIGRRTIILVDRINLATQMKRQFIQYGLSMPIEVVTGVKEVTEDIDTVLKQVDICPNIVVITTVQSGDKLATALSKFDVVICDEAHHAKARTWVKVLKGCVNASWRFGFSGTVFSKDEEANYFRIAYLGEQIFEERTASLVERKILSKPVIRIIYINPKDNAFYKLLSSVDDYNQAYEMGIAKCGERNGIVAGLARSLQGKTLILFRMIKHGEELTKLLPKAIYVDGMTPAIVRDEAIKGFNRMAQGVMLASTIFDEGIDLPGIHNLIVASAGKSDIKVIQRLGRGLRMNDTGIVNVFDFYDKTNDHLERHSLERIKIYKEEGHQIKLIKQEDNG